MNYLVELIRPGNRPRPLYRPFEAPDDHGACIVADAIARLERCDVLAVYRFVPFVDLCSSVELDELAEALNET